MKRKEMTITLSRNDNQYISFIEKTIKDLIKQRSTNGSVFENIENQLVFGTLMPKTIIYRQSPSIADSTENCLRIFRGQYLDFCRKLLGSHFASNQKQKLQPFVFAFVDFERQSRRAGAYDALANAHVHFLMLIHPSTSLKFREILDAGRKFNDKYRLFIKDKRISYLDVEFYSIDKGPLDGLISYCSKTARLQAFKGRATLLDVFPQGTNLETFKFNAGTTGP